MLCVPGQQGWTCQVWLIADSLNKPSACHPPSPWAGSPEPCRALCARLVPATQPLADKLYYVLSSLLVCLKALPQEWPKEHVRYLPQADGAGCWWCDRCLRLSKQTR